MLPVLAVVMTVAITNVPNDYFRHWRSFVFPSLTGIVMTYFVLGGPLLVLAAIFINDKNIWTGFVLVAFVPPAVAVIPFTFLLKGDVSYTLAATVSSYLAALVIMPVMFFVFIGEGFNQTEKLIEIMFLLIVLPIVISRLIIYFRLQEKIAYFRGMITDWGFFIVLYTIIGLNRELIFKNPQMVLPIALIIFSTIFILGFLIRKIGYILKVSSSRITALMLLGTLKNQGVAGGMAITLFAKEAALPSAIYTVFMIIYFIWLDLFQRSQNV